MNDPEPSGSPSEPDPTPLPDPGRRGYADDIDWVDRQENRRQKGREPEWGTGLEELQIIPRRTSPPTPTTEAFVGPALVLLTCVESGATPAATLYAMGTAVVISIATHLVGRWRS
nr:hypothetical protein [Micromonospora sp. DSM 115978]